MGNIVIATPDLSDAATVTASGETSAGPAENLKKKQPTDLWQAPTLSPYLEIDLGAVSSINLIGLLFTNGTASGTWRVRTADTQADLTAAPAQDVSAMPLRHTITALPGPVSATQSPDVNDVRNHALLWVPAGWSNRWVRIDIADATNPDGTLMVGRLYIANALQLSRNYDYGAADGYDDSSTLGETDGGQLIANDGTNRPVFEFVINASDETERHSVNEINRSRGATGDVLVVTDPNTSSNPFDAIKYGLLQKRRIAVNSAFNRHTVNYQIKGL